VADTDLVGDAITELYAADLEQFISRRKELAAAARSAGDAAAAKAIAGLAKPARPAWVVNKLVREDPGVAAQLADLGGRLRAGEASLDGALIRELSAERRQLVEGLVRRAMANAGLETPPAALREDVAATFNAALADPSIAQQVASGALLRPARWTGFSPDIGTAIPTQADRTGAPGRGSLAAWPGPALGRPGRAPAEGDRTEAEQGEAGQRAAEAREAEAREAEQREAQWRRAVQVAERTLTAAQKAAEIAASKLARAERAVELLNEQLAGASDQLTAARAQAENADHMLERAREELAALQQ
jgi:hypothetical protein